MPTDILTITKKLNNLKTEVLAEKKAAEEARLNTNLDEKFQKETSQLLAKVYRALEREILSHCGTDTRIHLYVERHELRFKSEETVQVIAKKFRETCGLELTTCNEKPNFPDYLTLDLTGKAKICTGLDENEAQIELDYPALISENNLRHKCWEANYPQLAKQLIDEAKRCLDTMPNKYYGIPQLVSVKRYYVLKDKKSAETPFTGDIAIGNIEIQYGNLTQNQVNDLNTEINKLVSHGDVLFEKQGLYCWMQFNRQPKKIIEQPYYDYADFYLEYDNILPRLQKVFDAVIEDVKFPPAESQILNLSPQRTLVHLANFYCKANYNTLQHIKETIHWQHLIDEINKKIAGIHTTEAKLLHDTYEENRPLGKSTTKFFNERVEFPVEVNETENSAMIIKQLKLEQLIWRIKTQHLPIIADKIIEAVVENVYHLKEQCGQYQNDGYLGYGHSKFIIEIEDSIILDQLKEIDGYKSSNIKIDLKAIKDTEFMKNLEEAIVQQSKGIIRMEMKYLKYELVLSE